MVEPPSSTETPPRSALAQRLRLPRLSGKASAAWLVVCFVLTALLVPMALRLPAWVEFELVLGVWWLIWATVLTRLLYTGRRVADDHQMREARFWFNGDSAKSASSNRDHSWWDGFSWAAIDGELFLILLGLVLLLGVIWLLFEIVIPVVLFLLYLLTRGMLAQVVNDRHRCQGHLGRALGWGMLWATAYTIPLAWGVWFIHAVHERSLRGA